MTGTAKLPARPAPRRRAIALAACALGGVLPCGWAQTAPQAAAPTAEPAATARTWAFTPSVSLEQTFTDNYKITTNAESDAVTRATLAMRLVGNGSRLRGSVDYALSGVAYARHSRENEFQNALNARGTAELVENFAFIDVNGTISQQQVSAFGPTSSNDALASDNRTEVRTVSVSPYLRGQLGSVARYELRATETVSRSSRFGEADYDTSALSLSLYGGDSRHGLGWSLAANTQTQDYTDGASTHNDILRGTVAFPVMDSLVLTAIAGTERNDIRTAEKKSYSIAGGQLEWAPSPRTNLSARVEHRYFGNSHAISFTYRSARTVWTFLDTRDVSVGGRGGSGNGTVYDLLFRQFAAVQPDVVQRDLLVRSYLALYGLDPNTTVIPGFLTASPTLQRNQSASVAWVGLRSNVVLQLVRTTTEQLRRATDTGDDFNLAGQIVQTGVSAIWSHRLTPQSSMTASASWTRSTSSGAALSSNMKSLNLGWSTQLATRLRAGLGARYTNSSGSTAGYTERAVFANVAYQF